MYKDRINLYKYTIASSDQNIKIYVNLISSPAGKYLSRRPHIIAKLNEILDGQKLRDHQTVIEKDMGINIGTTDVVMTTGKDTIYYAQEQKSQLFTRIAKNRYPQPSNILTIIIVKDSDDEYQISDIWVGPFRPAIPGAKDESPESKKYWADHAYVQDSLNLQNKTITKVCPY